jgi:hypothetical protein
MSPDERLWLDPRYAVAVATSREGQMAQARCTRPARALRLDMSRSSEGVIERRIRLGPGRRRRSWFSWTQVRLDSSWPAGIYTAMLRLRPRLAGFIEPCLPSPAPNPPAGEGWIHEIKLDGFRVIARKKGAQVRLYSRPGNDLTYRFPLIVDALVRLRSRSCCTARHSNSIRTAPTPTARDEGTVYSGALPSPS